MTIPEQLEKEAAERRDRWTASNTYGHEDPQDCRQAEAALDTAIAQLRRMEKVCKDDYAERLRLAEAASIRESAIQMLRSQSDTALARIAELEAAASIDALYIQKVRGERDSRNGRIRELQFEDRNQARSRASLIKRLAVANERITELETLADQLAAAYKGCDEFVGSPDAIGAVHDALMSWVSLMPKPRTT